MLNLLAFLAGVACVLSGLWLAWPPLALVAAGSALVAVGLLRTGGNS